jgi:hypothetical protein
MKTILALLTISSASALVRPLLEDLPLNMFPMLQSHDAGTGYLNLSAAGFIEDIVYRFVNR